MSRGFVREGDQEEAPVIPPRAALPEHTPNYVTPQGFKALKAEKLKLLGELSDFKSKDEREQRRKAAEIDGMLNLLNERINSDRKSTRLNSSHVRISYAVFCLKKKRK